MIHLLKGGGAGRIPDEAMRRWHAQPAQRDGREAQAVWGVRVEATPQSGPDWSNTKSGWARPRWDRRPESDPGESLIGRASPRVRPGESPAR